MDDPRHRYSEILQVAPSASAEEIRQAYVDLVRVWHPDRFMNDPRLQKIAEDRMKEITEAYEALTSAPAPADAPPLQPAAQRADRAAKWDLRSWLVVLGSAALLLALVAGVVQAIGALAAPYRAASFMKTEGARIAGLFGPDPALDGSSPTPVRSKAQSGDRKSGPSHSPSTHPASGADLIDPRGGKGLGEFHVRNESDLDCVLRVVERSAPATAVRIIYIQARQETSIAGLKPGIYRLRVSFGQDWDMDALAFARTDAPDSWIGPFEFFETQDSAEHRALRYTVGLRPPTL